MRRLFAGLVLSATLLAVAAPIVAAHECVVSTRSAQGNTGADRSGRWAPLALGGVFGFIHTAIPGGPPLTPDQIDEAVEIAVDQGLPADGWLVRIDKTIGEGSKNPNLANGKGLDHLEGLVGEQIVGIYLGIAFPD